MVEKCASVVILTLWSALEDSTEPGLPKRPCLGTFRHILWTDKNSNGKVVSLSSLAPAFQAFFTVPVDLLTLYLPALLLFDGASMSWPYTWDLRLEAFFTFLFYLCPWDKCVFVHKENGSVSRWLLLRLSKGSKERTSKEITECLHQDNWRLWS